MIVDTIAELFQLRCSGFEYGPAGCWEWPLRYKRPIPPFARHAGVRHREVYEWLVGPVPPGLQLDHVYDRGCRSKRCVNPAHLEPVTRAENQRRSWRSRKADTMSHLV
jgi:hypothetical protein